MNIKSEMEVDDDPLKVDEDHSMDEEPSEQVSELQKIQVLK